MSTAEKLAEALPKKCPTYSTTSGDHVVCKKCGETWATGNSRACYRALETLKRAGIGQPAADGAQRVDRMSDEQIDRIIDTVDSSLDGSESDFRAFVRAIETHLTASWGVKLGGDEPHFSARSIATLGKKLLDK